MRAILPAIVPSNGPICENPLNPPPRGGAPPIGVGDVENRRLGPPGSALRRLRRGVSKGTGGSAGDRSKVRVGRCGFPGDSAKVRAARVKQARSSRPGRAGNHWETRGLARSAGPSIEEFPRISRRCSDGLAIFPRFCRRYRRIASFRDTDLPHVFPDKISQLGGRWGTTESICAGLRDYEPMAGTGHEGIETRRGGEWAGGADALPWLGAYADEKDPVAHILTYCEYSPSLEVQYFMYVSKAETALRGGSFRQVWE
jgi:hypothetical protein